MLPALRSALEARGVGCDVAEAVGSEAIQDAVRTAVDDGVRYVAAVGGDGTVHHVANGLFADDEPIADGVVLAIVSAGQGGNLARTIGMRLPPERLATRLASPGTMDVDLGVVEFVDEGGEERRCYFTNAARVGYGAEVTRLTGRLPRSLGRFRHLLAAWAGIRATERHRMTLELAHAGRKVDAVELAVAQGQFVGAGLRMAPRATPDDGRFNILAFTGQPNQVFVATTDMVHGRHLPSPDISEWQSPFVAVDCDPPLRVAVDDELVGRTPARFTLLPGALRLKI